MRHSFGVSEQKRVAVLSGGWSAEREVSLKSGAAVADALRSRGYEVLVIDPPNDLVRFAAQLVSARPDVVFNALHGTGGEDGTIQGALDMFGVPYTHSGLRASALAMNKRLTKQIARGVGVPLAEEINCVRGDLAHGHPMPLPYVVKPVAEGSSIGVTIVHTDADRETALHNGDAAQEILVERYIAGDDLTATVWDVDDNPRVLGITQLIPTRGFYDYEAKYVAGVCEHVVNPLLPSDVIRDLHRHVLAVHHALGCCDISRSEFRYNPTDGLVFLELNTHPGMTATSLVPEQALAAGISFPDLVEQLIQSALRRFSR